MSWTSDKLFSGTVTHAYNLTSLSISQQFCSQSEQIVIPIDPVRGRSCSLSITAAVFNTWIHLQWYNNYIGECCMYVY